MPRDADNKLKFRFIRMGQGDCTLIKCPTGEVYVVDIGSAEADRDTWAEGSQPYDPADDFQHDDYFGSKSKVLDGLILTHPDKDHMNKLVILHKLGVTIERVYFSEEFPSYNKGSGKGTRACDLVLRMCLHPQGSNKAGAINWPNIRGVKFNANEKVFSNLNESEDKWKDTAITKGGGLHEYTDARGIKIHDKGGCQIYLLVASLVAEESAASDDQDQEESRGSKRRKTNAQGKFEKTKDKEFYRNMGSIVTLVEFKNKQYLICGDATGLTTKFLMDTYPAVENVELVQAPHHGSNTHESSSLAFVKKMNPRVLVVSAARETHGQALPRWETLMRYFDNCARLKKKDDDSDAAEQTFGCYSETRIKAGEEKSRKGCFYNNSAKLKATIHLTGWHDMNIERS